MGAGPEFGYHHETALDEPHTVGRVQVCDALQDILDPWSGRVDQCAGTHNVPAAILALHLQVPCLPCPSRPRCSGPRQDQRAEARRIDQVQNHNTRIVDPTIAIFERVTKLRPDRPPSSSPRTVTATTERQSLPTAH